MTTDDPFVCSVSDVIFVVTGLVGDVVIPGCDTGGPIVDGITTISARKVDIAAAVSTDNTITNVAFSIDKFSANHYCPRYHYPVVVVVRRSIVISVDTLVTAITIDIIFVVGG